MSTAERVHLIGIGGAGMSALAFLLNEAGYEVSGSDVRDSATLEQLRSAAIEVSVGPALDLVRKAQRVVISPAIPRADPERRLARQLGLPIQYRAEALAQLLSDREIIAVAGSHGKSTTATMLVMVLREAGLDPGFMLGAPSPCLSNRTAKLSGGLFVLEACEAFGALSVWTPRQCIITSIADEHSEHYGGLDALRTAYTRMAERVPREGSLHVCGDDIGAAAMRSGLARHIDTYGLNADNNWRAQITRSTVAETQFGVFKDGAFVGAIALPAPGAHNVRNAMAATAMAAGLDVPFAAIASGLARFTGVSRRLQFVGEAGGVRVFDDFAHHPDEIEAALATLGGFAAGGDMIVALQPQLESRVLRLADRFARALAPAKHVLLAPLDTAGVTQQHARGDAALAASLRALGVSFTSAESVAHVVDLALAYLSAGDVFVAMGPGRADGVAQQVLEGLRGARTPSRTLSISSGAIPEAPASLLLDRIFEHAAVTPNALAAICNGDAITYEQLIARAGGVADALRAAGAKHGDVVGVRVAPSVGRAVAFVGVALAGCVFLPIDPALPPERSEFILADAGARLVLTDEVRSSDSGRGLLLLPHAHGAEPSDWSRSRPSLARDDPAYIIYTSGSSGRPKGVVIAYGALSNFARSAAKAFEIRPESLVSQVSAFGFDVAVGDAAMALHAGACLVYPGDDAARAGRRLADFIEDAGITHLSLTPSALSSAPRRSFNRLTHIVVAGEVCPQDLADAYADRVRFFNAYGPTEATILATFDLCRAGEPVTIGRAMDNTVALILDESCSPAPRGARGELWLAGEGLASGYLGQPELTAEQFRPAPGLGAEPVRAYRTGDLATMMPDGRIIFNGRADGQVKLRGYRIELGEIEVALRRHHDIDDAIVDVRRDAKGVDRLVAYIVGRDGRSPPSTSEIRDFAADWLPVYMRPDIAMVIDEVPLGPTGKRDRGSLPGPSFDLQRQHPIKQPATETERRLLDILSREAGLDAELSIRDRLSELGIDSLRSANFFLAVEDCFNVCLPSEAMSGDETVELLALYLEQTRAGERMQTAPDGLGETIKLRQLKYVAAWMGVRRRSDSLVFTRNQTGSTSEIFWCCQGDNEHDFLARALAPHVRVHGMRSGHLIFSYTPDNIAALATLYADEVEALQPQGALLLGGNCQGGTIARALALQLIERGRDVSLLWLMEQGRFPAYDGPVTLIFGEESHLNPRHAGIEDALRLFNAAYRQLKGVKTIPGTHGNYFEGAPLAALAEIIRSGVRDAQDCPATAGG